MRVTVIVGGTRKGARQKLQQMSEGNRIQRGEGYDEALVDDRRIIAMGGSSDDVCWLRQLGFDLEIIVVETALISYSMWKRIKHVRSAQRIQ